MRRLSLTLTVFQRLSLLIALTFLQPCCSQLPYPLLGQESGGPPIVVDHDTGKAIKVEIKTSALLERILAFKTMENTYSAVWWVVLTWTDSRAGPAVSAHTGEVLAGTATCKRPCDSNGLASAGCCDRIWLPHVETPNLIECLETQVPRYRISANASSGIVQWSTRLVGTWYAPLDFRAYPFDHQHLLMQLAIADSAATAVGLAWEHVAKINNTAHTKGADMSGWRIKWAKGKVYDSRSCYASYNVTTPRYVLDPSLPSSDSAPSALYQSVTLADRFFGNNLGKGITSPPDCGTYADVYDEARILYGPIVLVADIMIKRVGLYFVMTNLIPVLIISIAVFVVFYMPCNALSDRMVVVMTLFLALTAMQFVFEFPPANYMNALQQVVLLAYVLMLVTCLESLVVNRIAILPQHLTNTRQCMRKYSKVFRRINMIAKFGKPSISPAAADAGSGSPTAGGSPRPLRVATRAASNLARSASRRVGGSPVAAVAGSPLAGAGRNPGGGGSVWARALRQPQVMSRFGSEAGGGATPGAAAPAAIVNVPAELAAMSVTGSEGGAPPEGAAVGKEAGQADLRLRISSRQPSATSVKSTPVSTPCALYDNHLQQADLFAKAAEMLADQSDGRPSPSAPVRPPSCLADWLYGCALSVRLWVLTMWHAPAKFYNHCKEDADFAWFIACRIDKWCCVVCFVLYAVCVAVLLWVQTQVGDHKLMLGDQPGNM